MAKGLTLIELIVTVIMLVILIGVVTYVFHALLISWSGQETRAGIDIGLDRGMEEVVRDLREAKVVGSLNNDEVRFSHDNTIYYIYYLFNEDDSYPPSFNQDSYELKRAALTGDVNGTFTYGEGRIIISDIKPPATSDISINGDIVTIDLSITRKEETIRSRTRVYPRNL